MVQKSFLRNNLYFPCTRPRIRHFSKEPYSFAWGRGIRSCHINKLSQLLGELASQFKCLDLESVCLNIVSSYRDFPN